MWRSFEAKAFSRQKTCRSDVYLVNFDWLFWQHGKKQFHKPLLKQLFQVNTTNSHIKSLDVVLLCSLLTWRENSNFGKGNLPGSQSFLKCSMRFKSFAFFWSGNITLVKLISRNICDESFTLSSQASTNSKAKK